MYRLLYIYTDLFTLKSAGGSGIEELKNALPHPLQSCNSWMTVKENSDRK